MGRPKGAEGKQKKPKDPNKPKRATSAYFYFLSECRKEAAKKGKSISKIAEFTKECSVTWRAMKDNEKKPFDLMAAKDKERYEREMSSYTGKSKSSKDDGKPKRPQSAYFLFLADFRVKMKGSGLDHKELLRKAGEEWRNLSNEDKMPYEKASVEEQKKYEAAMAAWRKGGIPVGMPQQQSANGAAAIDDDDEDDMDDDDDDDDEDDDE